MISPFKFNNTTYEHCLRSEYYFLKQVRLCYWMPRSFVEMRLFFILKIKINTFHMDYYMWVMHFIMVFRVWCLWVVQVGPCLFCWVRCGIVDRWCCVFSTGLGMNCGNTFCRWDSPIAIRCAYPSQWNILRSQCRPSSLWQCLCCSFVLACDFEGAQ